MRFGSLAFGLGGTNSRSKTQDLKPKTPCVKMLTGLDLIFLEVNSLEESLAFYKDVLGFEVDSINGTAEPPTATLHAGRLKVTLAQNLETMLRRGRGVHFFVGVDDIDTTYRQIQLKNIEVQPPVDEGWGGRFITVEDPDKYRWFLVGWSNTDLEPETSE